MTRSARSRTTAVASILLGIVFVGYPVLVWLALESRQPRLWTAALLCVLLPFVAMRMKRSARAGVRSLAVVPLVTIGCLALSAALDASGFLLAVPVAINAIFLFAFGTSLRRGAMPMVERFARLQEDSLSPEQRAWCRLWTIVWTVFFVVNGTTAALLALAAPLSWWTTYNGLIAYVLMGILFGLEWTVRRRRFARG